MRKNEEIVRSDSCFNKAADEELIFVLLGRDVAAPAAIRAWCEERVRRGKNQWKDAQIEEAMMLANRIRTHRGGPPMIQVQDIKGRPCYLLTAAWLENGKPVYLCVRDLGGWRFDWVADADKALRFAREEDAANIVDALRAIGEKALGGDLFPKIVPPPKPTLHGFIDGKHACCDQYRDDTPAPEITVASATFRRGLEACSDCLATSEGPLCTMNCGPKVEATNDRPQAAAPKTTTRRHKRYEMGQ